MLFAKKKATSPVHVKLRTPEIIDGNHNPRGYRLKLPAAAVIAKTPQRPQQQRWRDHMKQAKKTNRQRHAGIEHIFRAADRMSPGDHCAGQVDDVKTLEQKQPAGLPGK